MRICLTMIVKNEAHVIARAINSVKDHISDWVIVDTGSTDATEKVARKTLDGIEGVYLKTAWEGFAAARNRALEEAERRCNESGYALIVDADAIWHGVAEGIQTLSEKGIDIGYVWSHGESWRTIAALVLRLHVGIRYYGAVHEKPVKNKGLAFTAMLPIDVDNSTPDGASYEDPDKFLKHARILEKEYELEPSPRIAFYLAQSYRNHGDDEKAVQWYMVRANAPKGYYPEEVYISLLEAGRALWRLNRPFEARLSLLSAIATAPERREAKAELGRLMTWEAQESPPTGTLFVEKNLENERALNPRHQLRRHLVLLRECGACNACCTLLEVPGFPEGSKPAGTPCTKLAPKRQDGPGQCTAIEDRPKACSAWSCAWRNGSNVLFEDEKPDKVGVMITCETPINFTAYEVWPGAFREPNGKKVIERLAQKYCLSLFQPKEPEGG